MHTSKNHSVNSDILINNPNDKSIDEFNHIESRCSETKMSKVIDNNEFSSDDEYEIKFKES